MRYIRKTNRKSPNFEGEFFCADCKIPIKKRSSNHIRCFECTKAVYRKNSLRNYYHQGKPAICIICNKEYTRPAGRIGKFCSHKCFYKHESENRKGKNNPAYKHGYRLNGKKSLPDLHQRVFIKNSTIIKDRLLAEKGYLYCERCLTNQTLRWETHHIKYRSEEPNHPNLHHLDNLIHLCIKCHNFFHKKKSNRNYLIEERKLYNLFPLRP